MLDEIEGELLKHIQIIGPFEVEEKKTSSHLTNGGPAFLGLKKARKWLDVTLVSTHELEHPLIKKSEQLSKNRWHTDMRITSREEINASLIALIKEAYDLAKSKIKA